MILDRLIPVLARAFDGISDVLRRPGKVAMLLGGSILVETVFNWPGTGFLLNDAIFRRDIPTLQGTILVLAMFFVFLNLIVDIMQTLVDPRMRRG